MFKLPLAPVQLIPSVAITALLLMVFLLPQSASEILQYDRIAISNGEYWRLATGQYVHLTLSHLLLNLLGVWFIWLLFAEYLSGWSYLFLVTLSALFCNLGMWLFNPEILLYVGFSGVLYALFTWGALKDIQHRARAGFILLLAVVGKATYEYCVGPLSTQQNTSNELATAAHFYGVTAALLLILIFWLTAKMRQLQS